MSQIPVVKLNKLLADFYATVKKTDGSDLLATSLYAIHRGLDRILKNADIGFSITNESFNSSTKKCKEKLRVLRKARMSGACSRHIVYFSLSDEEQMWRIRYIHQPPSQMETRSLFYLTAWKDSTAVSHIWYEEQRMEWCSLRGIDPKLAKKIKLD
ncbi:hypothetical protein NXF25_006844 [Crotalus adamanteus]|uniref:Uncharacterized protein n=1 Tax=Crotalus adamanteus TaxID=8729 RepID=A0AAW1C1H3_CROAD